MTNSRFVNIPLKLIQPSFASPLTDVIMELEHLRRLTLRGDTPVPIFFQLKYIFHLLESLGSARIEGNHTTLADYIETKIVSDTSHGENIKELENIEKAMNYLEENILKKSSITHQFIRQTHVITVEGLKREGDKTPGSYRTKPVTISGSPHCPPDALYVQSFMDELIEFINQSDSHKYDLLKVALAHHRFAWIHPFSNGNGRVVRLLTYALLVKYGYNVKAGGRILNPTAVFCNDRDQYYAMLALADKGTDEGLETWCTYVLKGILDELEKVDKLTHYDFLKDKILIPSLDYSRTRGLVTRTEETVLRRAVEQGTLKASDIHELFPNLNIRQRTYQLKKLVDAKMLQPVQPNARTYTINFTNNSLIRGVMKILAQEGFAPPLDQQ
jgi:Fic family protein